MTANQIAYNKLLEDQRSHLANEELTRQSNEELKRHNQATEDYSNRNLLELTRHNFETERISAQDSERRYQSSIYNTDVSAAATRYAADASAAATKYAAQVNASASRYVADTNASATRYVSDNNLSLGRLKVSTEKLTASMDRASRERVARLANQTTKDVQKANTQAQFGQSLFRTATTAVGLYIGGKALEMDVPKPKPVGYGR